MRVAALMSGGVDSAVAAARLLEAGHTVVGVTMRLRPPAEHAGAKTCCGLDETHDARRAAAVLGIPHYVLNCEEEFSRAVVDYFVTEYQNGRTPSPCMACNHALKFDSMLTRAHHMGCEAVATGHYARVQVDSGGHAHLLRGRDEFKDQSYFLAGVRAEALTRVLFPLGDWTKADTRAEARRRGLPVAEKPESQEICFVPDDYRRFLAGRLEGRPGAILDPAGRVVGEHPGYWHFTVGQRRGLGVAAGSPLYVASVDAATNTVAVADRAGLLARALVADRVNVLSPLPSGAAVQVKIRSRSPLASARVFFEDDRARVTFDSPVSAVAPGQYVVWYVGDEVCGSAVIAHAA